MSGTNNLETEVPYRKKSQTRVVAELFVGHILILLAIWTPGITQRTFMLAADAGLQQRHSPATVRLIGSAALAAGTAVTAPMLLPKYHSDQRPKRRIASATAMLQRRIWQIHPIRLEP